MNVEDFIILLLSFLIIFLIIRSKNENFETMNDSGNNAGNIIRNMLTKTTMQPTTMQPTTTIYKVEDSIGIKNGNYKNISNNTFGLNSNLTNWTITIMINSSNYSGSWQSIVGNMYNNDLQRGWGIWVSWKSVLHWRIVDSTWDLDNLGKLIDNTPYKIVINFDNNSYKFTLTNLNTNISNSQTIQTQLKLEASNGFITLGGYWNNLTGEQFNGNINYLDFSTTVKQLQLNINELLNNRNKLDIRLKEINLSIEDINKRLTEILNSSGYKVFGFGSNRIGSLEGDLYRLGLEKNNIEKMIYVIDIDINNIKQK